MERAFALLDRAHPFNGVSIAQVQGPLCEPTLRAALDALSARHPLLRMRLSQHTPGDDRSLQLTESGASSIPLAIVHAQDRNTWQAQVEDALNTGFSLEDTNLARLTWVRHEPDSDENHLILTIHHVAADATSHLIALRDLFTHLAPRTAPPPGSASEPTLSLPLRPPLPGLLPPHGRGLHSLGHMHRFFQKHILGTLLRPVRTLPLSVTARPSERRTRFLHHRLGPAALSGLLDRAKQEQTTIHAALGAALLLATRQVTQTAQATPRVGLWSAVNLRHELTAPLADELGLYISQVTTFHRLPQARTMWDLARELKRELSATLSQGEQYLTMPLIGIFVPWGKDPGPRFVRRFDGASPSLLGLTNLGRLNLPATYGPLTLQDCHIAVSPSVVSQLVAAVTTFEQTLTLNLLSVHPLVPTELPAAILRRALDLLLSTDQPVQPHEPSQKEARA